MTDDKLDFETLMRKLNLPDDREFRTAMRNVSDTAHLCRKWFEQEGVPYTAADLLVMANMVLKRERDLGDAEKRQKWEKAHRIGEDAP
jgi:hypothetical protein